MSKVKMANRQYAALPYRRRATGGIEVMLITSRDTGRWIIPKGWPEPELAPGHSAAQEAMEESGLVGKVSSKSIGRYRYSKRLEDGSTLSCSVDVFALEVEKQLRSWPERDQRRTRWFKPQEAAEAVQEPELAAIFRNLKKLLD
jgi:8-oxo-dGTP pyrophosphatase MutT (NUDIX family)